MADPGGNADEMLLCKGIAVAGSRGFHRPKGPGLLGGLRNVALDIPKKIFFALQVNKVMNTFFEACMRAMEGSRCGQGSGGSGTAAAAAAAGRRQRQRWQQGSGAGGEHLNGCRLLGASSNSTSACRNSGRRQCGDSAARNSREHLGGGMAAPRPVCESTFGRGRCCFCHARRTNLPAPRLTLRMLLFCRDAGHNGALGDAQGESWRALCCPLAWA